MLTDRQAEAVQRALENAGVIFVEENGEGPGRAGSEIEQGASVIKIATVAFLLLAGAISSAAEAKRPSDQIELHDTLEDLCAGIGSPQSAAAACSELERLYPRIKTQGWCKGRARQKPEDARWHVCGRGSL